MARKFLLAEADGWKPRLALAKGRDVEESCPTTYFFYGTLMNPAKLQSVLNLKEQPHLTPAKITGYRVKAWGPYPALVDGPADAVVHGVAYDVQGREGRVRLARYETENYRDIACLIQMEDGIEVTGRVFFWNGDENDLRDASSH